MSNKFSRNILILAIVVGLFLAVSACSIGETKGMKPSPDWSKGVPVATDVSGSHGFAVRPDGQSLFFVYPHNTDDGVRLHLQHLDADAALVAANDLDIPADRIRRTRLLLAEIGHLHLFWESRNPDGNWELWYAPITESGQIVGSPVKASSDGVNVGRNEAAPAPDGSALLVWDSTRDEEIHGLWISPSGQIEGESVVLVERGTNPSAVVSTDGSIGLSWVDDGTVLYAQLLDGSLGPVSGTAVADIQMGTGDTLFGPVLGKTNGWTYLFWSRLSRAGLTAGQAATFTTAFPDGDPAIAARGRPEVIGVLPLEDPPYQPYTGIFNLTQIIDEDPGSFRSDYAYEPNPFKYELDELLVGIATKQTERLDQLIQVATLHFDEGSFKGFNFSGSTPDFSSSPSVAADVDGNLYFSWKDGSDGDLLFLSTTAPEMKAQLDRIEAGELANTLLQGGIEGLATILLFPLAIPWVVPGYILLGVWKIYRDYESLAERSSWIVLIVSIILYEITKFIFLPTISTYVPFSAWIDIPPGMAEPLRIGFPIFSLGLGILIAEINRRRDNQSTLLYYTIVVVTDLLLSLGVYGVAYLGVF